MLSFWPNIKQRIFERMTGRLLSGFLVLSLVPLIVVAYQGYHCGSLAVRDSVAAEITLIAENRTIEVEQWLEQRRGEIAILAANLQYDLICAPSRSDSQAAQEAESIERIVNTFMANSKNYETLVVYDRDWNIRFSPHSSQGHPDKDFNLSNIRSIVSGAQETSVSSVHRHGNGDIGLHLGARLEDDTGSIQGYVLAAVDFASTLNRILRGRKGMGENDDVFLVDANGSLLTRSSIRSSSLAPDSRPRSPSPDLEPGRVYRNHAGVEVIGAAASLESVDWKLVVERDLSVAMEWQFILARRAGSTFLVTLALVFAFALWMSLSLSRPFRKLESVAELVRMGDHSARVRGLRLPEARGVGMALNAMLDELQLTQGQLAHAAALSAVGQVSSSVVHEMRNPLSSVKMNLQALAPAVASRVDLKELSDIALSQVRRIETMLGDLLNFAKPMNPKLVELRLFDVIEAAADAVRAEADAKDVKISLVEELGDAEARADEELLCRAITNLLLNAIQASPVGGSIQAVIKGHDLRLATVNIEVSDEGEGVSTENRDRLFSPFFTTKDEGTGLGLANVKKITEYHGGKVEAENRPGNGALFRMILPLSKGAQL